MSVISIAAFVFVSTIGSRRVSIVQLLKGVDLLFIHGLYEINTNKIGAIDVPCELGKG